MQPKLLAILVQPVPDNGVGKALGTCKINRAPMAVPSSCRAPSVKRVAPRCPESDSQTLSVVVTKCAQNCPTDARGVQSLSSGKELFPEVRIHAADDIFLYCKAETGCGGDILPGEVPVRIQLCAGTLIYTPQIFLCLIDFRCPQFRSRSGHVRSRGFYISGDVLGYGLVELESG